MELRNFPSILLKHVDLYARPQVEPPDKSPNLSHPWSPRSWLIYHVVMAYLSPQYGAHLKLQYLQSSAAATATNWLIIVSALMPLLNSHLHDVWSTMPLSDQLQLKTHEWRWFCKGKSRKYIVAFYCVSLIHHFARKPSVPSDSGIDALHVGRRSHWRKVPILGFAAEKIAARAVPRCSFLLLRDDSSLEQRLLWFVAGPAQTWLPGFVLSSFAQ